MANRVNASVKLTLARWTNLRCAAALICVTSVALCASPAVGQWPDKAVRKAPEATATPALTGQDSVAEIRKAEAAAKVRLAKIETGGSAPADAPPGTPPIEITARLTYARQLVSVYDRQLVALERLKDARERRQQLQRALQSWRGFDNAPPRSVLVVDALRDELDAANHELASAREARALFERFNSETESKIKAAQGEARLAAEAAERARGSPDFVRHEWQQSLAARKAEVDSQTQALLQIGLRATQVEQEAAELAHELARRKLLAAGSQITMPRADLDKVYAEIEQRRLKAERALERATKDAAAAQSPLQAVEARQAAERVVAAGSVADAGQLAEFDRELAVAREVSATANQRIFLLREHLVAIEGERLVWGARVQAINLNDAVRARDAHERLSEELAGLRASKQYVTQQLSSVSTRIREEQARQRSFQHVENVHEQRLLATLRERESDLRAALDASAPLERVVRHFRTDFEGRRDITAIERIKDAVAAGSLAARQVWNYEMFTIDDTVEAADGRKITASRGVTIGKTFGAVLIVLVGYLLANFVLGVVARRRVASGRVSAEVAALGHRWILFVLTALLVIFALFTAQIPFTAFAFLGGALAIAAGFGLQTLLKNLVSGVMLLVERPMRIGDLVEVDGLRGRVTEIGLRASTIRGGDGMESIVPNSRFVEGNMTNWTYSNLTARQTIQVRVAYGSHLRTVNDILNGVLARYGLILKKPAPQVYLAGYEDSGIKFTLNYWVEMTEQVDSSRIKGDLLHMIDGAFGDARIAISYSQKDTRLSLDDPAPTTVVPGTTGRAAV
jgi:potassium-dependent mechanosensitive channel